jgi:hypothetical protein
MSKEIKNKTEIKNKFKELLEGKRYTPQERGFEFEKIIYSVLQNENLEPRSGYKPEGEQIDGSFFWSGQTFLLEAKWVAKPLPASSIYSFKGKLDGKFHTTSGVFLSVNGYSEDVEDALKFGKSLNILLFCRNDIELIFNGELSFLNVLKFKLRQAGDTGSLLAPYDLKEKAEKISHLEPTEILKFDEFSRIESKKSVKLDDVLVFVEGRTDIPIIKNFIEPIKHRYSLSYRIETLNGTNNIRQLPSLLNIYGDLTNTKAVIVILDDDQSTNEMNVVIQNIEKQLQHSSVFIRTIFLFISEPFKIKLRNALNLEELRNEQSFKQLEVFVNQIAEDYYDPIRDIPQKSLEGAISNLVWNFEEGTLNGTDETYDMPFSIDSLDDLVEYLEEEIVDALNGEMPLEWLKSQSDFEYRYEVQEFLLENYSDHIDKLGWNSKEL